MTEPTIHLPDLASFDWILVSTSAGKDSQAMSDVVAQAAQAAGVLDRVVFVHADLGSRVEWAGTLELAAEHAAHYGCRFEAVSRRGGDLLDQIVARRAKLDADADALEAAGQIAKAQTKRDASPFPSNGARFCTSDHKRDQIKRVYTLLTDETRQAEGIRGRDGRRVRILDCIGRRAQEGKSRARAIQAVKDANQGNAWQISKTKSNGKREVVECDVIADWLEVDVWARIAAAGTRSHQAYEIGMPRLSCVFCIYAPREVLVLAGIHNREKLEAYVAVEDAVGSSFQSPSSARTVTGERWSGSLREVLEAVDAGEQVQGDAMTWGDQA